MNKFKNHKNKYLKISNNLIKITVKAKMKASIKISIF